MSDSVITVENLGKRYRIRHQHQSGMRYKALRDVLTNKTTGLARRLWAAFCSPVNPDPKIGTRNLVEDFWALRSVSFEVKQGETLGIIGRNGAGKSTLLKIFSRITEPTEGRVHIKGRVASLLEVGTGFHPELTGRENIFLNGAILGMTGAEIKKRFDQIVAFAEVEKFLDTPVKHYSSGMYVRLAFAVAAHLEPEILIVDEVLAVGDAAFQQKCLGKMQDVSKGGRTVLFVSHNMSTVQHLCRRALLLRKGTIATTGQPAIVLGAYLSDVSTALRVPLDKWQDRTTSGEGRILELEILTGEGKKPVELRVGGALSILLRVELRQPLLDPIFGVIIHDSLGDPLLDLRSTHAGLRLGTVSGPLLVRLDVKHLGLYPGRYLLSPWITDSACRRDVDFARLCCAFEVHPAPGEHGNLKLDRLWGKYFVPSKWQVTPSGHSAALTPGPAENRHANHYEPRELI